MEQDATVGHADQDLEKVSLRQFRGSKYAREVVLAICVLLLMLLFGVTAIISRLYHAKVQALARDWTSKGASAFRSGNVAAALTDYRNALVYSPNDAALQLHLAQALAAAGRLDEAESYFMNLLAESPGNGEVNLELARIAAKKMKTVDAMRYYQSAIYGVWDANPLERRWKVRRELSEYLLTLGHLNDAQPEIIGLVQEVPAGDLDRQKVAGEFLLRAQLWDRALAEFTSILKFRPLDEEALTGAGTAAFQLGRYSEALADFDKLAVEKKPDPRVADLVERARAIVSANPWAEGLSAAEKSRRTLDALRQAAARAEDCARASGQFSQTPPVTPLQNLYATSLKMAPAWREANLARHPERIDAAMALAFQLEDAAAQQCGEPQSGPDRALRIMERSRARNGL